VTRAREFLSGVRDTLPLVVGAAPFGIVFGTLAIASGLSPGATLAMSALVFAGASQFIAVSLLAGGTGIAVILFTTLIVNLRHVLYSAALLPHLRHLGQRWRIPLAFWLTDETFAVAHLRYRAPGSPAHAHWYHLGSCLLMYLNWQLCTLIGATVGDAVPEVAQWGLDFAMVATFIGIVVPLLRTRPMLAAALSAAAVALMAHALPYRLGLLLAALAGVAAGVAAERRARSGAALADGGNR
jgi:4-azaleucine resistance transporter AzlC